MKFVIAFTLAMITAASAQFSQLPLAPTTMPKTVRIVDNATGELVNTMTIADNRIYFRNAKGEHYATVVINPDGTRSVFDPSGKAIEAVPNPAE